MLPVFIRKFYTVQVGDLILQVFPNEFRVLNMSESSPSILKTQIVKEDLDALSNFIEQAEYVIAPIEKYLPIVSFGEGDQVVHLLKDSTGDYAMVINDQVQFTKNCERSYHEALVSPAIGALKSTPENILILGGGDGLAAKQVFKEHPEAKITLVDYDSQITEIFTHNEIFAELNEYSLLKCNVVNADAFEYIKRETKKYDIIICDFPDPDKEIFSKLYSFEFYSELKNIINNDGILAVQAGPLAFNNKCMLCIKKTIESTGFTPLHYFSTTPYGPSNFIIAGIEQKPKVNLRNKYETLNQEFFERTMAAEIPSFYIDYNKVQVNTVKNKMAFYYKMLELKKLKED